MLSLIICSRSERLNNELSTNISATIGIPYEIVLINNADNRYSICEAYNLGVQQSRYNVLCFMHDDIAYHTNNWGQKVLAHFANPKVKAIGIAGTPYYPFMPGPWWGSGHIYEHLLQAGKDTAPSLKSNSEGTMQKEVVLIDGCWMCMKKSVFTELSFDQQTFTGYHFYDADICMQLHTAGHPIYTVADVLIDHASLGDLNKPWIDGALTFHKKWQHILPANCLTPGKPVFAYEYKTLNAFIWTCFYNKFTNRQIYQLALKYLFEFKKGYGYHKTPGYLVKFLFKYLFKKGAPFYTF
ncbi:hypothetical protein A0256_10560 [Mucilaginibacter sp. PAMC 26640]|nr:hypothetical protein A0256_10560 [Mucilaginibacter sp. PAMC 26640]